MSKYLYGASVQGIQGFIFQTNKLAEIAGASELVEEVCNEFFRKQVGNPFNEKNLLIGAAGNIKYIFEDKNECEKVVRNFPKAAMEMANGITISQAVIELKEHENAVADLEKKLRVQRNKAISIRDNASWMVTETARKTGGAGVAYSKDGVIDLAQEQKDKASKDANKRLIKTILEDGKFEAKNFPFDISDMIKKEENQSWIAVIHADGNSLGNKLIRLGELIKGERGRDAFRLFSQNLDYSTKQVVKQAFNKVIAPQMRDENVKRFPFRPVILGRDDLTVIIRGDLAMDFTHEFLKGFEEITKQQFDKYGAKLGLTENPFANGLTACAGIAYIKANYPFHYGVSLAEKLCQEAKDGSKKINERHAPSSLMFHKVQASFVEEYDDIIEKELRAKKNVFFNYGPYFITEQNNFDTVENLIQRVKKLNEKRAPKSGLRNWLTELKNEPDKAMQTLERISSLNKDYRSNLSLENPFTTRKIKLNGNEIEGDFTPIYDAMSLSNI